MGVKWRTAMANYLGLIAFSGLIAAQFLAVIAMRQYQRTEEPGETEPTRARKLATA
jgi:formate hydrogenlyase subunit 3/multisubunit Na+/H+ antiporter MnhD subunit